MAVGHGQERCVVADDHRGIATLLESVEEQISRDIDIGALLFCLPNFDGSRTIGWRIHKRHPGGPGYKMTFMNFNEGEGTKSSDDVDDGGHPRMIPAVICPQRCV